eukprot:SAG11_NODE_398_length_9776_cov_4.798801_2_plen_235_part_00
MRVCSVVCWCLWFRWFKPYGLSWAIMVVPTLGERSWVQMHMDWDLLRACADYRPQSKSESSKRTQSPAYFARLRSETVALPNKSHGELDQVHWWVVVLLVMGVYRRFGCQTKGPQQVDPSTENAVAMATAVIDTRRKIAVLLACIDSLNVKASGDFKAKCAECRARETELEVLISQTGDEARTQRIEKRNAIFAHYVEALSSFLEAWTTGPPSTLHPRCPYARTLCDKTSVCCC